MSILIVDAHTASLAKIKLEHHGPMALLNALVEFEKATELTPAHVKVSMKDRTPIGSIAQYQLNGGSAQLRRDYELGGIYLEI